MSETVIANNHEMNAELLRVDSHGSISGSSLSEENDSSADERESANCSYNECDDGRSTASESDLCNTAQYKMNEIADNAHSKAINYCIIFSVLMFTLPLVMMYLTYRLLFKDYNGFDDATAALYAGITAIVMVILIVSVFVWIAYKEEENDEISVKKIH